jgi:hypothetical protein
LVREPSEELVAVAARYVCVRVVDMSKVDLDVYEFDYDLTLAALLMHADGTVFHRFGSRDHRDPTVWNTLTGLAALMHTTLEEHAVHRALPAPAAPAAPRYVVDLPPLRDKLAQHKESCVHCHTVHDTLHAQAVTQGTLTADTPFVYPLPARLGLELEPATQHTVRAVAAESPAARAGLQAGDRLLRLGRQSNVATLGDVQWALHHAPAGAHDLAVEWRRGATTHAAVLALAPGWKRAPPREYAWRPYKWNLAPDPGFGGGVLDAARKQKLGLDVPFALRIDYLIDWGEKAHRGRAARRAGLRVGDIVLGIAGQTDFVSHDHFQAFVRLSCQVGEDVEVMVWRDGARVPLKLRLPD